MLERAFSKAKRAKELNTREAYDEAEQLLREAIAQEKQAQRRTAAQHVLSSVEAARAALPPAAAPSADWNDVIGQEDAKEALREALVLPALHPELFVGARRPWRSVLLWGPPGTGKTLLARAAAAAGRAAFFTATPADLFSKWLGESEGAVRDLFVRVRAARPSVLFFDEIDALCRRRSDEQHETSARVVSQFLTELDGVAGGVNDGVFFLAATNHPHLLDPAMLRRFECRIKVGLPDAAARAQLVAAMLGDTPHAVSPADVDLVAQRTEGFSGADLGALVRAAAMGPVREMARAQWFRRQQDRWVPCHEDDEGAARMGLAEVPRGEAVVRPVEMADFDAALASVQPATTAEMALRYKEFENA